MEARAIYRKSEKGAEAIATRGHGVSGKLRMLLILVDGKKSVEELALLASNMGESVQSLQTLQDQGLIEVVSSGEAAPDAATPSMPVGGDLGKLKVLATRLLIEQIGPLADELALKLEASKDLPQFVDTVKRAYSAVRDVKGQAAADRFGAEIEAQMQS